MVCYLPQYIDSYPAFLVNHITQERKNFLSIETKANIKRILTSDKLNKERICLVFLQNDT